MGRAGVKCLATVVTEGPFLAIPYGSVASHPTVPPSLTDLLRKLNVPTDRHAVAERIRGLIAGQDAGNLAVVARRLGVEELALRMTVDERSPHPVLEVVQAVITYYGVDPNWLLTGEYDAATHRAALESDREANAALLRRIETDNPPRSAESGPPQIC